MFEELDIFSVKEKCKKCGKEVFPKLGNLLIDGLCLNCRIDKFINSDDKSFNSPKPIFREKKRCPTCGREVGQFELQCRRCEGIDTAFSRLQNVYKQGEKTAIGYYGRNICFDCGKPISTTQWYRGESCAECQEKENKRFAEALELRQKLLEGRTSAGKDVLERVKHFENRPGWWRGSLPKSY